MVIIYTLKGNIWYNKLGQVHSEVGAHSSCRQGGDAYGGHKIFCRRSVVHSEASFSHS